MAQRGTQVRLIEARLPDFGVPETTPELPPEIYAARFGAFATRVRQTGLSAAVIYADREHFANMAWLTGFDPRFEEALLIFVPGRDPVLLTGPENQGSARAAAATLDVRLYPPFGLLGQDRSRTPPLADIFREAGITAGMKIGVLGWKYFGAAEADNPDRWIESPAFVVDTLRAVTGAAGAVVNATALMMDASAGLRAINEVDQLAVFEAAACTVSEAVKRAVSGVRPGMREREAASLMGVDGAALSAHLMLSAGPRAALGLGSPADRRIERGDPFTVAYGIRGALTCRAGFVATDETDLAPDIRDYVAKLAAPYFACAAAWYEAIGIGVSGGALDALVKKHLGDPFFGVGLNPGHLIHLDEWLNTPIYPGSTETLKSGQAIQLDIIPATGTRWFTSNIEDGVALLDERGRAAFRARYPQAWDRVEGRRAWMADILGIRLKPEVLPFSNLQGWLPPFLLSPERVFTRR